MTEAASRKLYTLTEVSKKTKISLPTLQRYKKLYQDQIPSRGKGAKQRYPEEALDVFMELRNLSRRGAPRKSVEDTAKASTRAARRGKGTGGSKRGSGRAQETIDAAKLKARIETLEKRYRRLEGLVSKLFQRKGGEIVSGRHIAEPATAREIRDALGVNEKDVAVVRNILRNVG